MTDKLDELLTGFYNFKKTMESSFAEMGNRFDQLEDRLAKLENRLDRLENKAGSLEQEMNKGFDQLYQQYKTFSKDLRTAKRMAGENMRDVKDLEERVENLEAS